MNVNLFFNWLWIGELLTFKTGPPCITLVSLFRMKATYKKYFFLNLGKNFTQYWTDSRFLSV